MRIKMGIKRFCRWSRLISFFRMNILELFEAKYIRDGAVERVADMSKKLGKPRIFVWIRMYWICLLTNASLHDYYYLEFYGMTLKEARLYWSRGRFLYMLPYLSTEEVRKVMRKKNVFNRVFADFIGRDWMLATADTPPEQAFAFVEKHGEAIMKPACGNGGMGVRLLEKGNESELSKLLKGNRFFREFMIEERVKNHEVLARFSTQSLNTLRVISVIEPEGVRILCAFLKFNTVGSVIDNLAQGAYACPVNPDTGVIELGLTNKEDLDGSFIGTHPFGFEVVGLQLPYWDELKEMLSQAMRRLDGVYFCPWDVAITPGGPILIEGNTDCGTYFQKLMQKPVKAEMNRILKFAKAERKRLKRKAAVG